MSKNTTSSTKLADLQLQIKTLDQNWKRALADYRNLSKRIETDKREFVRLASLSLLSKLLPTLDVLKLAALHSTDAGVKMAVKQFQQALESEGLLEISPLPGDTFDPSVHECIETLSGGTDNTIAQTSTTGYKIDDYVIRPAKVKVFKEESKHE